MEEMEECRLKYLSSQFAFQFKQKMKLNQETRFTFSYMLIVQQNKLNGPNP